jgi:hypothetical protein
MRRNDNVFTSSGGQIGGGGTPVPVVAPVVIEGVPPTTGVDDGVGEVAAAVDAPEGVEGGGVEVKVAVRVGVVVVVKAGKDVLGVGIGFVQIACNSSKRVSIESAAASLLISKRQCD